MISSIEYLDGDVSDLLAEYVNQRGNYQKVIKDIYKLIDVNRCAKYLRSFDSCKNIGIKERLNIAYELLTNNNRCNYIHNWPTKPPYFAYYSLNKLLQISNEDYIIKETKWKLKRYPPPYNRYKLNNLNKSCLV